MVLKASFLYVMCVYPQLSYSSGLVPLKMYRDLQRDMGPYHTVCIALYMFYKCFLHVQMRHIQFYIVTCVRSCCRINRLFTEYRETSLVWCRIVTRAYGTRDNTSNRLVTFPCTQWIIRMTFVTARRVIPCTQWINTYLSVQVSHACTDYSDSQETPNTRNFHNLMLISNPSNSENPSSWVPHPRKHYTQLVQVGSHLKRDGHTSGPVWSAAHQEWSCGLQWGQSGLQWGQSECSNGHFTKLI